MRKTLINDILAGLTVSFAALSLGAAFGIMSGRGAFAGMLGAAVIPIITSLLGGTRIQASGPTAPMTAVTAVIVAKAYESFPDEALAGQFITFVLVLASLILILSAALRLGKFISVVPQVVILGFMNGIGVLIWVDQFKKLLGGGDKKLEGSLFINLLLVGGTLALIYLIPYVLRKLNVAESIRRFVPSIFVTIVVVTILTSLLHIPVEHVSLGESFASFGEFLLMVKSFLPIDTSLYTMEVFMLALPLAFQLWLLAYLDSLLTSLVIDKMTKETTKHNKELFAQGIANGVTAILQGIPGAQATIRSVLLLKEGAKTRLAGVFAGIFALLGFLVFGKWITLITSAVFVGVLLKAGLDVLDRDFPIAFFQRKWFNQRMRLIQLSFVLYTTLITVLVDLNVAVISGTILFFACKYIFKIEDVESDFAEVESEELTA